MKDIDYLELIYGHRAEMVSGGFHDLLKEDADYQKLLNTSYYQQILIICRQL